MKKSVVSLALWLLASAPAFPRQDLHTCGTYPGNWRDELHLHERAKLARKTLFARFGATETVRRASYDLGNVAILEESDGVVGRPNEFNLDRKSLTFQPLVSGRYRFQLDPDSYDPAAAASGNRLDNLEDDDSREVQLPFSFPFFGRSYTFVFINSDGNLTFTASDTSTAERSLGRLAAGPPRIAPLFRDLDPSKSESGVRVHSAADRFIVTWMNVPDYRAFGTGPLQTFQIRLYPDGRIQFAYSGVTTDSSVVGIAPGRLQGGGTVVSFVGDGSGEFSGSVAERFGGDQEIDIVTAAQRFYETHEDSYDYIVIFNNLGVRAADGAVAYEVTVRNDRTGYGDVPARVGEEFGSKRRLQAVMNMGPLNQYPSDPAGIVQARSISGDTPMSILGHEAGHLFLAFASVRDPDDPRARPMLGRQGAHWNFTFNSEASLLEGNRIRDNGPNARPRFMTVATVEGFSALDQYLMGFRALEEVPPTFLVVNADISPGRTTPQSGVPINGERRDIRVEEIVQAEGRRTPDHTVSQRRFRFAFLLVVPRGAQPSADDLARLETYRREFETYFARVTSTRAVADTTLVRSLRLSVFPAAGVLAGGSLQAAVSLEKPAPADLTVLLRTQNGNITAPPSVTIPAGASVATFPIRGVRAGVDDLAAEPGDNRYSAAYAKVQVSSASDLNLTLVSGSGQRPTAGTPLSEPIEVRLTDINNLPYPDVRVQASVNAGGRVDPAVATTGEDGIARFRWTPGTAESSELRASLEGNSAVSVTANTAGPRVVLTTGGVLNAASFTQPIAPGSIVSLFGAQFSGGASQQAALPLPETLAGVQVQINGRAARLYFVSDGQINLVVPPETTPGPAEIVVITPDGPAVPVRITVMETAPGIFFDAVTGEGAVLPARPRAGDVIEIYATGLGATRVAPLVTIGGVPAEILFSGAAPGFPGMNQVNARVPAGAGSGTVKLAIEAGERRSNEVTLELR